METKVCTKCRPPAQPIENFGWKDRLRGKRHAVCTAVRSSNWYYQNQDRQKENVKNNNQQYRQNVRDYMFEYLSTHPCRICGETDEALIREIKKCSVVCANCHRRITAEDRGWYKRR